MPRTVSPAARADRIIRVDEGLRRQIFVRWCHRVMVAARQLHLFPICQAARHKAAGAFFWFRLAGIPGRRDRRTINPHATAISRLARSEIPVTGARLKRLGTMPGWPDLQFAGPAAESFSSN
jgi:hypothetical protein